MLEELIAGFLSLFSAFTMDTPNVHRAQANLIQSTQYGTGTLEAALWQNVTHAQYGMVVEGSLAESESSNKGKQVGPTYSQSMLTSIKANLTITLAVFPLAVIGITFLYFDLRTCNACFEWRNDNNSVSFTVSRLNLIGDSIETMLLYLWFPATLTVLFGWPEFKRHYTFTVLLGLLSGLMAAYYLSFLLLFGVYNTNVSYRIPTNVLFAANLIFGSIFVVRKIRKIRPFVSYSNIQIMAVISVEFLACFAISMFYRYAAVPLFNALDNEINRFIVAAVTPLLAMFPTAICKHMALWRSSKIIDPQRSFILVYVSRGASIILYRIMQADFKSLSLFVGLSLFSGFTYVFRTATLSIRTKIWTRVINVLRATCCSRLRQLPTNTPHYRRLKADTEIQNILFENNTLILSQAYLVLYMIISFELSDWSVMRQSLIRLGIGLTIEFFFNSLSIFIHIHWHNVPIPRVWWQCWMRHVFANAVIMVIIICYFTTVLLSVFQVRMDQSEKSNLFPVRNCTMPYENWR